MGDASAYALVHGVRRTRSTLAEWNARPLPILRRWLVGSLAAAALLLVAVWVIATIAVPSADPMAPTQPPFATGGGADVARIAWHNGLVLALHAMACVAGFIAGSSLPLQAARRSGLSRWVHERGRPAALGFVVCATAFSLSLQAYTIGRGVAEVAVAVHATPALVLLGLLPHAVPELVALFLPLSAWIGASRSGEWDGLLAATLVTVALAVPRWRSPQPGRSTSRRTC